LPKKSVITFPKVSYDVAVFQPVLRYTFACQEQTGNEAPIIRQPPPIKFYEIAHVFEEIIILQTESPGAIEQFPQALHEIAHEQQLDSFWGPFRL
jgi:hypothetical protein